MSALLAMLLGVASVAAQPAPGPPQGQDAGPLQPATPQQPAQDRNAAARTAPSEERVVRVSAEGYDRDDAIKQALRKALEQGAAVQIGSYSQTESYTLVRDTIISRAAGIVSDYRVLRQERGAGGTAIVEVEARVRPDAVAAAWAEVQNVLDQLGRPKIMVWIDETIDGQPSGESIVASRIEQMFVKSGFDLVERRALDELRRREQDAALRDGDGRRLAGLARDAGADILIRGSANANRAGNENLRGVVPAAFYNCDVQAKAYHTDTGRLIASESLPSTRAGVRSQDTHSPQAARAAMVQATFPERAVAGEPPPLAVRLYEAVMQQWATKLSFAHDIDLEVEGLDFESYLALRDALRQLDPARIRSVDGDFSRGVGRYRIKAAMMADVLAEVIARGPLAQRLEVVDLKMQRIQAKARTRP